MTIDMTKIGKTNFHRAAGISRLLRFDFFELVLFNIAIEVLQWLSLELFPSFRSFHD